MRFLLVVLTLLMSCSPDKEKATVFNGADGKDGINGIVRLMKQDLF